MKKFAGVQVFAVCVLAGLCVSCATGFDSFAHGQGEYEKQDWNSAIKAYTQAIEEYPRDAEKLKARREKKKYGPPYFMDTDDLERSYLYRGWAYYFNGEPEKARDDFNELLRMNPDSKYALQATQGLELEHFSVPVEAYQAYLRGTGAVKAGDHQLGIDELSRAITLAPQYRSAYNSRGVAYLRLEDYGRAEADFTEAVRLDPEIYRAYANLSTVKRETGDLAAARRYTEASLKLQPGFEYGKEELEKIAAAERAAAQKAARVAANLAWNRRIAENPNPYPAPFNGTWKHVSPAKYVPPKKVFYFDTAYDTREEREGSYITRKEFRYQVTKEVNLSAITVPPLDLVWEFNGNAYRKTVFIFTDYFVDKSILS
ncbi:MAG: tetratricopeptide repeat protein [Treponema sp.]|jgi:tetratricopeptide (TPR) repeat protein|nr:tetratricopeptide repeat protein [Treponema sp.]